MVDDSGAQEPPFFGSPNTSIRKKKINIAHTCTNATCVCSQQFNGPSDVLIQLVEVVKKLTYVMEWILLYNIFT